MIETSYVDINNIKKILKCCPYYDDIINSNIEYTDELSIDLIDWYKDLIFSCDGDNNEEVSIIKKIDKSMYNYVNNISYRKNIKKIISVKDIDLNSRRSTEKLINKIINYNNKYEREELLHINISKWI